ncbi:MAG: sigma-70 family RNA polymerase sigma factor [Rhodothermales bacterium]|nr:sigma-70 family RNA polymerase sigma factor [Rhodothermales bacterium]MCA0270277.1 sigma-70 family RNA polymerase sigma factor [Bacteroidota bacterium]
MSSPAADVTTLLGAARAGDDDALRRLVTVLYDDLHRVAGSLLRGERADHTLGATALVHEAFLRLAHAPSALPDDRARFFGAAATAMRRILVDYARRRNAERRGGGQHPVRLDTALPLVADDDGAAFVVRVGEAVERLERIDPRLARVVELRFFVGFTEPETAEVLGVTDRTVRRDWTKARAFLERALADG